MEDLEKQLEEVLNPTQKIKLDGVNYIEIKGDKGDKGDKGEDGYTPIKGVDYFDGLDGKDGIDGKNGLDGLDGKDGLDGYTPEKGIDYFTKEEIDEMSKSVATDSVTFIESLEGEDRLSATALKDTDKLTLDAKQIKNLPKPVVNNYSQSSGGGSSLEAVRQDGVTVKNGASNINFIGATVVPTVNGVDVTITGGSGAVDSVNGATGVVVLDADDIDDTSTTNKFATATQLAKVDNITITQAVDLDALETASHAAVTVSDSSEIDFTLTGQQISAAIVAGSIDETKLDASTNTSLDLADTSLQPGDNITELNGTAWRVFYSNGSGDVTELALGADGTFLKSNGASSAPTFATPAGSGDVSKVGTPVNNQVGVWTGDGTLEGDAALTFDTTTNTLATEIVTVTDDAYGAGWNGSTAVPTKNAVYDKIETLSSGGVAESLAIAYAVSL